MTDKTTIDPAAYIVCGSHRARGRFMQTVGTYNRQCYNLAFTDHDIKNYGIYPVTVDELPRCLLIKGVKPLASKRIHSLSACWNFS